MTTSVIFYRARGTWSDRAIRVLIGSAYSHCELVGRRIDGTVHETIAASKRDGNQVRVGRIDIASGHWDLLTFNADPERAWQRAERLLGAPYDMWGAVLSATALARPRGDRWFCSEIIAHSLGFLEPWEFSPGMLAAAAKTETI